MKKLFLPVCFILLLTGLLGCGRGTDVSPSPASVSPSAEQTTAVSPSPLPQRRFGNRGGLLPHSGKRPLYLRGRGYRFAAFDVYIDYTDDNKVQLRQDNGGTVLARVVEVGDGAVTVLYSREDSYARENYLNRTGETQEILLMEPIEAGTSWTLADGRTRQITDTAAVVDTPSGTYTTVAVETAYDGGTTTQYYAKGVGLVKRSPPATTMRSFPLWRRSKRTSLSPDGPFLLPQRGRRQDLLPGHGAELPDERCDQTGFDGRLSGELRRPARRRLSENAVVNSLYLNDDGMVYIDSPENF